MNTLPVCRATTRQAGQRGAATLVVVMVLFFLISMVAAYTSRNLVFEQRTSTNQYRSTRAAEAADAGLQWALGLLNSGRIDADCRPSTSPADTTFRDRYLEINSGSGEITPKPTATPGTLYPSCVFDGTNWQCSCPVTGLPSLTPPSGGGVYPAFRVRFTRNTVRPTLVWIEVNACTRYAESCLAFPGASGEQNEGRASVSALLSLKGALTTVPAAALTARGNVDVGGAAMSVYNTDPKGSGTTVHTGGVISNDSSLVVRTIAGGSADDSKVTGDASLSGLSADRMFVGTLGMRREVYRDQPAAVVLACSTACSASTIRAAIAANPGRPLWAQGDVNFDSAGDIGSAADPVALVVSGNIQFATPVNFYGLIYTQAATWTTSGTAQILGGAVAEGNVAGTTTATFAYDPAILTTLRVRSGSFVVVPGSWKDFQ